MSIAAAFLLDYDNEISNTRRTLERVPADKMDWRPHPKSMPLGKLAMHCATLPTFGVYIIEDDGMDMNNSRRPHMDLKFTTLDACLAALDDCAAKTRLALSACSDEHLAKPWVFSFGETIISNKSRAETFRNMCFDHMIHHTAQLGVYLRLLDLPVPALYGPSADEQWTPK